jgi:hypothetical protein
MKRLLIICGCAAVVVAAGAAFIPRRSGDLLTIGFVGYTNYAGVRAAIFTVTNHSAFEIGFSGYAQRRASAGWENVYPGAGPLGRGDPTYGLFDLPGGQTVTFMTTVLGGSWHGAVNYRWPETKWDRARGRLAWRLQQAGLSSGITESIYHRRAPVIHSRELQEGEWRSTNGLSQ